MSSLEEKRTGGIPRLLISVEEFIMSETDKVRKMPSNSIDEYIVEPLKEFYHESCFLVKKMNKPDVKGTCYFDLDNFAYLIPFY